jgi:rhodanese-related sulfurtransferase/DNA-binding transcriptional ArsR family regulator
MTTRRQPAATSREVKDALYAQFARVGHALASPARIELLDLLGQGEKTVDTLARQVAMPVKNVSAHLRVLRQAHLVDTRRAGKHIHYRLGDDSVLGAIRAVETVGRARLAEVERVVDRHFRGHDPVAPVTFAELRRLMRTRGVTVIDVRPAEEFAAGHIPGAVSLPAPDLKRRLRELPRGREVIAYCRGQYCVLSLDAVTTLRARGFRARRAHAGLPDWRAAGHPVTTGPL